MGAKQSTSTIPSIKTSHNIIKLFDLFETNGYVKLNPQFYRAWLIIIQIIPIGTNYEVEMYTDIYGNRNRESLYISSHYNTFYTTKLPIYEHLRIENMKSIDAICVNDADFQLYNSIKNLLNKNQSSITLMNDK